MKKNRSNVLNRLIFESLSKSRGRVSDIVACHLYTDDELAERTKRPNEQVTHVEYFDEAGLSESYLTTGRPSRFARISVARTLCKVQGLSSGAFRTSMQLY